MDLLRELHRGGATICMVTHDPRYARYADRSIHLFDGRVVEENMEVAYDWKTRDMIAIVPDVDFGIRAHCCPACASRCFISRRAVKSDACDA